MQGVGMLGMGAGMYCFGMAFTVMMPTVQLVILGIVLVWSTFGVLLYDCVRLIRNQTSRQNLIS